MHSKITLQPVYLLHSRPYRDTSLLVDLFSCDYGRISAIARGVRSARSRTKGLLQPFTPLLVSWFGKSELVTLTTIEANGVSYYLQGDALLSSLYINELLTRALHHGDPHPELYHAYTHALTSLSQTPKAENSSAKSIEKALRIFEKWILQESGYGLSLEHVAGKADEIRADQFYTFDPQQGFTSTLGNSSTSLTFSGDSLLALKTETLTTD